MNNANLTLKRLPAVLEATGLSRSALNRAVKSGAFPQPVKLGERSIAWRSDEVSAWIESRAREERKL